MAEQQDLPGALRVRDTMLKIAADSDLDQTAKLFAFCLLAYLISPERKLKKRTGKGKHWTVAVGEMMHSGSANSQTPLVRFNSQVIGGGRNAATERVRNVIAHDIPRYETPLPSTNGSWRSGCIVPKTRGKNAGKPCGKGGWHWVDVNPDTGEKHHVAYCKAHDKPEHHQRHQELYTRWENNGKPCPPANTGGILARYFHTDWKTLYNWANPNKEPLPNGKPPTPPRPTLTLIRGGG